MSFEIRGQRHARISRTGMRKGAIYAAMVVQALCVGAWLGLVPLAAAELSDASCKVSGNGTLVCPADHGTLRIIKETVSPDGRYGVAWQLPDRIADQAEEYGGDLQIPPEGGLQSAPNVLVRLTDGRPLAALITTHNADFASRFKTQWLSDGDSDYLVVAEQGKGGIVYNGAIYRFAGDSLSKPLAIADVCWAIARFHLKGKIGTPEFHPWVSDLENLGSEMRLACAYQGFKSAPRIRSFDARLRLLSSVDGSLRAQILSVKTKKGTLGE